MDRIRTQTYKWRNQNWYRGIQRWLRLHKLRLFKLQSWKKTYWIHERKKIWLLALKERYDNNNTGSTSSNPKQTFVFVSFYINLIYFIIKIYQTKHFCCWMNFKGRILDKLFWTDVFYMKI